MSKRRIVGSVLIIAALLLMLIPAAEADAETSASAFSVKHGELIKYTGKEKTVTVPNTVTCIGKGAFENNVYVEKIILPDSVEQIKAYAFWGCDNLKTVTIGKGLAAIGDFAFTNCTGLETITLPENVHSIGIQAFSECRRFEDITIPPQVVDIREDSFDGDYLLNIHCEEGSYADKYAKAFYERQKKMSVYGNANSIDTGSSSGNGTYDLTVKLPAKVPTDGVYSGSDAQTQTENDGKSDVTADTPGKVLGSTYVVANQAVVLMQNSDLAVKSGEAGNAEPSYVAGEVSNITDTVLQQGIIPERAHYRDDFLADVVFGTDVREIGPFAYARSGLRQVAFAEGLEKIDYAAFYHCDSLAEVSLPESVNSVEAKAFAHSAWVDGFLAGENGAGGEVSNFLISGGVLIAYRGNAAEVTVPDGVRVIAGEAFADHTEINSIRLPASLQTINDRAFAGCHIMDIQYDGNVFSNDVLEESVALKSLADAVDGAQSSIMDRTTAADGIPVAVLYALAGMLFLSGVLCVLKGRG